MLAVEMKMKVTRRRRTLFQRSIHKEWPGEATEGRLPQVGHQVGPKKAGATLQTAETTYKLNACLE
jgi:hypothetical protein